MKNTARPRSLVNRGFTLIELILVMTIIAILSGMVVSTYSGAQESARDTQRRNDIKQYQNALEVFSNANNGLYPSRTAGAGVLAATTLCGDLSLSNCPDNPKGASYRYQTDGSGSATLDGTQYVLWAVLERPSTTTYFVVCTDGSTGETTSGIPPSGGNCPI